MQKDGAAGSDSALRLRPEQLRRVCDPARFTFSTTSDLAPLDGVLGQARATEAIRFGLRMRRDNFNVFALGATGTGKRAVIQHFTGAQAASEPTPQDWVYVYNFAESHRPRALPLPAGRGAELRQAMRGLIDELGAALPAAFEADDYRTRRQIIDDEFKRRQEEAFERVENSARQRGIAVVRTPLGVGLAVAKDGHVLPPEEFHKLPQAEQERLQAEMAKIQAQLEATFREVPQWESERHQKIRELNRTVVRFAVGHLIAHLKDRFTPLTNVVSYLDVVEQDLVENAGQFLFRARIEAGEAPPEAVTVGRPDPEFFHRYQINLFVDHSATNGAPLVEEDHPTLPNLIGRVEFRPRFGALVTDFTLIRPGALHQANGGYLVLDARRVLMQPYAWEGLKRVLRAREIRIQSVGEMAGLISAETLQPEPIPLDVKVLLTGERLTYYLLCALDPDFRELFKVGADFDDEIARDEETELGLARLLATLVKSNNLKALDRAAVAVMVEQAARVAGDSAKLSAELEAIADLLREADFVAAERGNTTISAEDVRGAIAAQIRRASRIRERLLEDVERGTLLIETSGSRVGQVNGLSVLSAGGFAFGHPSRITARVRLGKGEVVDIQREIDLGGPIHSKGVLILSGYLSERFGRRRPLALSASIVFEQTYGAVEGDSASLAELCVLLSALAGVEMRQDLAVTGSVNQHGQVQPIGGANEKIEGFYDTCNLRGLTGTQGVIVPVANINHLMLRPDVVDAVRTERFHVFAVASVGEALLLLTGIVAGERDASGAFPPGTVNSKVDAELAAMAEATRQFQPRIEVGKSP